jgi:uncharacterized protein YjdB
MFKMSKNSLINIDTIKLLIEKFKKLNFLNRKSFKLASLSFFILLGCSSLFAQTGGALKFDGVGDKVTIANNAALDFSTGTVEAWVKPGASSNSQGFLMMRRDVNSSRWSAHINQNAGTIGIYDGSSFKTVNVGTITANTWYHVALVFSSGNTAVYVNGVSKGSTGNGINISVTGNVFSLGNNDAAYANEDFLGEMDEVRIWSVARSTAEILGNKDAVITSSAVGLIANYHFNQGLAGGANSAVTTLTDASGNSNTGTLVNFALTGATSNWVASSAVSCAPIVNPIIGLSAVCAGETITLQNNSLITTQAIMLGYSLRKLLGQYTGNAVRVRRSSDNAETNIGFTATGDFDEAALKTFAGSGNAFVTIWYDQSGSGKNMVQTNTGWQPQILFSGSLKYINSRPTIDFNGNKGLVYNVSTKMASATVVIKSEYTYWPMYHAILDGGGRIGGLLENGNTNFHSNQYGTALWKNGTSIATNSSLAPTNQPMVVSFTSQLAAGNGNASGLCIGNYDLGGGGGAILQTEAIAFATTVSAADRQTVEINQGTYYGITSVVGAGSSGTGTWTSDDTSIAEINSTTGVVTGKAQGTVNINYTLTTAGGCSTTVTKNITVNIGPVIAATTGLTIVCAKSTITLANATTGGVWSSSDNIKAIVDATSGVVTGYSGGEVVITYKVIANGCPSVADYTISVKATAPITSDVPVVTDMQILLVAGGGGGGMDMGGGGGGGGVIYKTLAFDPSAIPYTITIGAGGTGAPAAGTNGQPGGHQFTIPAKNGGNTTLAGLTAIGGGFGGSSVWSYTPGGPGSNGGSGGGASGYNSTNGAGAGLGTSGQGFSGGNAGGNNQSGGGGGAGGAGISGPSLPNGGTGIQYSAISPFYWGGGGGGSGYTINGGNGGIGGGGGGAVGITTGGLGLNNGLAGGGGNINSQTNRPGGNAGANTGGGGGGGSHFNSNNKGGDGGSGIVIIKYAGTPRATGGAITQVDGFTTHTFSTVGTSSFTVSGGGTSGVCIGASKTLANATPNGVWSSSNSSIASTDASTGVVTGNQLGSCIITYTVTEPTTGCAYSSDINFIVANPPTITAVSSGVTCAGAPAIITATPSVSGGSIIRWYDALTGGNLLYTGATYTTPVFTANVSYYVEVNNYGCSSVRTEVPVTTVLPITGTQTLCVKSTVTLSNATSGNNGVWTTSNSDIATVDGTTGVVTGMSGGNVVISYTVPTGTNCPATYNLTVTAIAPTKGNGVSAPFQVLVVAGGGGAGSIWGGGGGGGGVIYSSDVVLAPSATPFSVVIGNGGAGTPSAGRLRGTNGSNSSFNGLIAIGGGGGATGHDYNTSPASLGGSGGGASGSGGNPTLTQGGKEAAGTPGQGFSGGAGDGTWFAGGGGGAGAAGTNKPANGGIGIQYTAISPFYWGGGGGGAGASGAGGAGGNGGGGGGSGNQITAGGLGLNKGTDGINGNNPGGDAGASTGGGGGAGSISAPNKGGDGGSGIVIIKYLGAPKAVGGTITQSGGYTTHTFTTVGTNTFTLTDGGIGGVCLGNTTLLTNETAGGTWSSSDPTIASVDASGVVTGNKLGTCIIKYSVTEPTTGCVNTWDLSFIVASPPTKPDITSTVVCVNSSAVITASSSSVGQSFRWYDAPTGGNLLYTGETYTTPVFTSNVSYYVEVNSYGCSSPRTEVPLTTVLSTTGPTIVCVNSTITLANATTGGVGTWSSSETSIATVNPNTGVVTGVGAGGDVVISYTFPTAVNCPATYNVSVKAVLPITGAGSTTKMEILMVAGGGGGGAEMGGGGGGGGVIYNSEVYVTASNTPLSIVIGAGGSGTPAGVRLSGTNGSNTTFYGLTALGGGGGATGYNIKTSPAGNGGSGGGASGGGTPANGNGGAPGNGTFGQGFNGADGKNTWYPGGGGGAGGVGFSQPATGGPGIQYAISLYFWGGGGGGSGYSAIGGNGGIGGGGGGAAGITTGGAGLNNGLAGGGGLLNTNTDKPGGDAGANTGGGGGGGSHYNTNNKGGNGGSGIVIIKYLGAPVAEGGVITIAGGYTTHTFTTVGTNSFKPLGGGTGGVCIGSTTALSNATANGVWSSSDATIASVDASGVVTGNKLGTCTITYSVTEPTTNCVYSSSILFLVASPPSISSVTGAVTCVGSTAVITANTTSAVPTFRWYDAPTGGNLLYTGATYTTPIFTSNVSYYVEIDSYGCTSTSRTEVPVTAINVVITADNANYNSPGICIGDVVKFIASGATSYSWESKVAPLDDVASTYKLAVSLRKLRSAYAGSAIRLRRSSDNVEADFGFIGNDLNTAAISTWLGSANGFCVKLYDQSGNSNDMVPLSVGAQPLYVASGSSMNNKPILRFTTSQNLKSTFNFTTPYTATIAARYSGSSRGRVLDASNNWLLGWYSGNRGSAHLDGWVSNGVGGAAGTTPYVYTATGTGSASTIYENSVNITQNPTGGRTAPQGLVINARENSDCEIGEIIGFSSVLSTEDREWVEKSSGGYFGIYGTGNSYSTAAITVSPIETTTYVLKATSSTGCVVVKEVTVTVNQVPKPAVLAISGERGLAVNQSTTLTNATTGGQWFSSEQAIAKIDINSGLVNSLALGKTVISYVVTNSTGCSSTSTFNFGVYKQALTKNGMLAVTSIVNSNGAIGGTGMTTYGEKIITVLDGLSSGSAVKSASEIKLNYPNATDGIYWIDVPGKGPTQTYCLMDSKYDGGGWMLALKATRGTTFKYDANYWTTANTLNPTQVNRNDGDAKYDVMNAYLAKDMMALFPDIPNVSTESGSIDGLTNWSWLQNNFHNSGATTKLIDKFSGAQTTYYTSTNGSMTFDGYGGSAFSNQGGFTWYGINFTTNTNAKMRWGFAWNNETDQSSNDVSSGIGMVSNYGDYSAGDKINCCQINIGINRSARVEIYVR